MKIDTVLCIDVGNTRLKWAVCRLSDLSFQSSGVFDHRNELSNKDFDDCFGEIKSRPVWVSFVSSEEIKSRLKKWFMDKWHEKVSFVSVNSADFNSLNAYQKPSGLGVDRWLAMIAVQSIEKNNFCVVDVGTAITIDVVDSDAKHVGGLIMPGKLLMLGSLFNGTSKIDDKRGKNRALSTTTADGVESGVMECLLGGLDRSLSGLVEKYSGIKIIVTGGGVELFEHLPNIKVNKVHDLVLQGIGLVAQKFYA